MNHNLKSQKRGLTYINVKSFVQNTHIGKNNYIFKFILSLFMTGSTEKDQVNEGLDKTNSTGKLDAVQSPMLKIESISKQTLMTGSEDTTRVDTGLDRPNCSEQLVVSPSPGYKIESVIVQTLMTGSEKNNVVDEELNEANLTRQLDAAKSQLDAAESQMDAAQSQVDADKSQLDAAKFQVHKIEISIKQILMTRSKDNGLDEANISQHVDVTPSPGYKVASLINQTLMTGSEGNNQFNEGLNAINVPHQVNVSPSAGY